MAKRWQHWELLNQNPAFLLDRSCGLEALAQTQPSEQAIMCANPINSECKNMHINEIRLQDKHLVVGNLREKSKNF